MSRKKQPTVEVLDEDGVVLNHAGSRARTTKSAKPTPRGGWGARRSIHLNTLDDVRVEMARVYRAMANGQLAIADGARLTYALSLLSKTIVDSVLEDRIAALEALESNPLPLLGSEPEHDYAQ